MLLGNAACTPGVRWHFDTFDHVHAQSRSEGKLTLVYFRNWYSVACTEFEENVLKRRDVLETLNTMNCVPLDFDWDRPLAQRWQLDEAPAFVIIAPDGRVLARGFGTISAESLLAAIKEARVALASANLPAATP